MAYFDNFTTRYDVSKKNKRRLALILFIIFTLMLVLCFRMGYWQIVRSDSLKVRALEMQKVDTEIPATRGSIYDINMNVLARTVTEYELYGYTQYLYKSKKISESTKKANLKALCDITGETEQDMKKALLSEDNLVLLAEGLTSEQVSKLKKQWESEIVIKTKIARSYPGGAFAAQLLGSVNADNVGRTGLEYEYNNTLAGVKGRAVRTTDNEGNALENGASKYFAPQNGNSIVTTIDSVVQNYVEEAIDAGIKRTGAERVTCIVMNPKTGDVLALGENPDFDPNNSIEPSDPEELKKFRALSQDEQNAYLSRMWTINSVSSVYEPGSTFKLIAGAAALETGIANEDSRYVCKKTIDVDGTKLNCLGYHGKQSLKVAIGNSCNAALARVALDLGIDNYYNYLELFGLTTKTGIDLPGETNSIIKDKDSMVNVDLATTGYGQGIAITPIQILCAVNAMGNNGVLMQPKVVKKIVDENGKTVQKIKDNAIRQVLSQDTASKMKEIMEYYVADAGGQAAYVEGFRIGGKTGTANIAENGEYTDDTDTSYVAMAPMDDPVVSIIVIVHKPTKMQYGNNTAGPIVKEVLTKTLAYLGVERLYNSKEKSNLEGQTTQVPYVTNMDSKEAIKKILDAGLRYKCMPETSSKASFVVQDQYPKAGSKISLGSSVYIYSE